jgi:hypothetical protein
MAICPFCNSKVMSPYGIYRYGGENRQKYKCEKCGGVTAFPLSRIPTKRRPKAK